MMSRVTLSPSYWSSLDSSIREHTSIFQLASLQSDSRSLCFFLQKEISRSDILFVFLAYLGRIFVCSVSGMAPSLLAHCTVIRQKSNISLNNRLAAFQQDNHFRS